MSGNAVDIGSFDATAWLSAHGAGYGLCQTYANESWHYELHPEAIDRGCPGHVRRSHARSEDAAMSGADRYGVSHHPVSVLPPTRLAVTMPLSP